MAASCWLILIRSAAFYDLLPAALAARNAAFTMSPVPVNRVNPATDTPTRDVVTPQPNQPTN